MSEDRQETQKIHRMNRGVYHLLEALLILLIIGYPLWTSFEGIDLGDTGYHMFCYTNIFTGTWKLSMTGYFTYLVGWLWNQILNGLGLWGMNLLEVILEMLMAFITWRLLKPYLGSITTLIGIFLAVLGTDTYLNVFNYHQFNVFLLVLTMALEFYSITKDKKRYLFLTGVSIALMILARSGSVTVFVTFFFYFYWYATDKKKKLSYLIHSYAWIAAGGLSAAAVCAVFMKLTHHAHFYRDNVLRLAGLASSSGGGYSMGNLWDSFFGGNLDAFAAGFITLAGGLVVCFGINMILIRRRTVKERFVCILFGLVLLLVGAYQLKYAYNVNAAPSWPQMTSGPAYLIGIAYVCAVILLLYYQWKKDRERSLLLFMAVFLPLLTIAGSNTGTKHVVLGLWFIAPFCVVIFRSLLFSSVYCSEVREISYTYRIPFKVVSIKLTALILIAAIFAKFGHMIYYTCNFDSVNRLELTASIDSDRVKYLRTTEREANQVNGVLHYIQADPSYEEKEVMVFGSSQLLYYLLGMDSYVKPWLTNNTYTLDVLNDDLYWAGERTDELPYIVFCRTNVYYGFYESKYEVLRKAELSQRYDGKKDRILGFLDDHHYSIGFMNDYYIVLVPETVETEGTLRDYNYRQYMASY